MGTFSTFHSKIVIPRKKVAPQLLRPSRVPNGYVCLRREERRIIQCLGCSCKPAGRERRWCSCGREMHNCYLTWLPYHKSADLEGHPHLLMTILPQLLTLQMSKEKWNKWLVRFSNPVCHMQYETGDVAATQHHTTGEATGYVLSGRTLSPGTPECGVPPGVSHFCCNATGLLSLYNIYLYVYTPIQTIY